MNRQQKREAERKSVKLANWINSLSIEQEKAISVVINQKVDKIVYSINQALDTCVAAALNTKTDLSIKDIEEILIQSNKYMSESESFLKKWGDDWIMKLKEVEPQIKEECLKLLNSKKNQQQAVKALGEKFKDVPVKDLVNIFKETKEEWCKKCVELTQEDKKIISEKGSVPHPENKVNTKEKVSSNVILSEKKNEITTERIDNSLNTFEVVEKKLKFKGEYYDYEKDKSGLKVGCEFFRSLEEIEDFRKREEEEFKKMIAEVRAAFTFEG